MLRPRYFGNRRDYCNFSVLDQALDWRRLVYTNDMADLGKTVLIANPAAQTGRAGAAVRHVEAALLAALGEDSFEVMLTQRAGHAVELAAGLAEDVHTVIALGGDGVIHEVANGLMARPRENRPAFAVLPAGSGNDYAATLGMSMKLGTATRQILSGHRAVADVGECNGEYFVETRSFGLDAAIAISTEQLRQETESTGAMLYARAGVDQLLHHRVPLRYEAHLKNADNGQGSVHLQGESFIFAVQIGPTYGGHFKICPKARIDDGMFDICLAHPPLSLVQAAALFARAKNGWHVGDPRIETHTAQGLTVRFEQDPPAQMDGEKLSGCEFDISIHPSALTVIKAGH